MSDLETAAILSQKIYDDLTVNATFGLNARYKVLSTSDTFNPSSSSGYYGAIILDTETNTTWLTSRGTEFWSPTDIQDIDADLQIFFGGLDNDQFSDAMNFVTTFNSSQSEYPDVTVVTGQSLGGYLSQALGIASGTFEVVAFDSPGISAALNNLSTRGYAQQVIDYDYTKICVRNVLGDLVGGYGDQVADADVEFADVEDLIAQTQNGRSGLFFIAMSDAIQSELPNSLSGLTLKAGLELKEFLTNTLLHHNMENHTYRFAVEYAKANEIDTAVNFLYPQDDSVHVSMYRNNICIVETSSGEAATFYLSSDNGLYGIIENTDGTESFYYRYGNGEGEYISKPFNGFDDMSNLDALEQYYALQLSYMKWQAKQDAAKEAYQNEAEIINDPLFDVLPQSEQDQINELVGDGENIEEENAQEGEIVSGEFGTNIDGSQDGDNLGTGAEDFTVQQLAFIALNGEKSDQIDALLQLSHLVQTTGMLNAGTGVYELDGYSVSTAQNLHGGDVTILSHNNVGIGYITKYDEGNFQQRVVETVGIDGRTNTAQITLADGIVNELYRGEPITIEYPDDFVFGFSGGIVGDIVGQQLSNGELAHDIIASSITKTLGQNIGEVVDFLAAGENSLGEAAFDPIFGVDGTYAPRSSILDDFLKNLQAGVISAISSKIVDELGDAVGIDGLVGEVFDVAAGTVTTGITSAAFGTIFGGLDGGVYSTLMETGFDFSVGFYDPSLVDVYGPPNPIDSYGPPAPNTTVGDYIQGQVFNALAGYAGSRLAGEFIEPKSQQAAIMGSFGSAMGAAIGAGQIATTTALGEAFASAGIVGGPIGVAIGAFIGTVIGTFAGNAFGGEGTPAAWAKISYNYGEFEFEVGDHWALNGGDEQTAITMAQSVIDGFNNILDATGGKLRDGARIDDIMIGMKGNTFVVTDRDGNELHEFGTAGDAIMHATHSIIDDFELVGGYAVVMRAWYNTDAQNIHELMSDLQVAEAFMQYLADPTGILALMMDQPDSDAAQAWAVILQRAAELELHLPHERDLEGGWVETLYAQHADPSLIPSISDDNIILTDPVTGEETVIHHVIGPGYEIVRIEGTDGNDIIEVVVDGASITYVDGGVGNDIIEGSDQADILIGGPGDDTINGYEGNDWLHGGQGYDTLDGGQGDDLLVGGDQDDVLYGSGEIDHIYGNRGNDEIHGGLGADFIYGGEGDDEIFGNVDGGEEDYDLLAGGNGDDIIHVGTFDETATNPDNDTYILEAGLGDAIINIGRDDGHDIITGVSTTRASRIEFTQNISINELYFKQLGDDLKILVIGEDQSVTVEGFFTSQVRLNVHTYDMWYVAMGINDNSISSVNYLVAIDSQITIEESNDNFVTDSDLAFRQDAGWINGWKPLNSAHDEVIIQQASSGDDTVSITPPKLTILGGAGNDTLSTPLPGEYRHEYFYGDSGNDIIHGGNGLDMLIGGLGNDILYGETHEDILFGGQGNDLLFGGISADYLDGGSGDDYLNGGSGDDEFHGGDGDDYIISGGGNNQAFGGEGNDTINFKGSPDESAAYGESGDDILIGGEAIDSFFGGSENDQLFGYGGNDWLEGNDGVDVISGGDGDDNIYGGQGNDSLSGGNGHDYLNGGDGNDQYYFEGGETYLSLNKSGTSGNIRAENVSLPSQALTFSATFRPEAAGEGLFSYAVSSNANEFTILTNPTQTFLSIAGATYSTGYIVSYDEWHDLIVTWDGVTGQAQLFDNGALVYSGSKNAGATIEGNGIIVIGQDQDNYGGGFDASQAFHGDISEFAVWDSVLDTTEITSGPDKTDAIIRYEFVEGVGTVVSDSVSGGHAQIIGDVEWVNTNEELLGFSTEQEVINTDTFITMNDGATGDRVQLDNTLMPSQEITIDITFKSSGTNDPGLISYAVPDNANEIMFYNHPGQLYIAIAGTVYSTGRAFSNGEWRDLTVTWNGTTGRLKAYDDGVLFYNSAQGAGKSVDTGGILMLGQDQDSYGGGLDGAQAFHGDIASLTIWDRIIDQTEITDGLDTSNAVHHFNFDDGLGTTVTNDQGNGDALLIGSIDWTDNTPPPTPNPIEEMGVDIIRDSAGSDIISFGDQITLDKLSFSRDIGSQDDLIIELLDNQITIVEDQFAGNTIETLKFSDDTTADLSSVSVLLEGTDEADILYGTNQEDVLSGGLESDIFVLSDLGAIDTITDFSRSEGDILDISEILSGYDPISDAITDFVQITDNGTDSVVSVDIDGGADSFVQVATLLNVTGFTDEAALETSGNLIV